MKIRNTILKLCILLFICMPIKANAGEMEINTHDVNDKESQIIMLDSKEAEKIHMEFIQKEGIAPYSDLAMSTIGITKGDNIIYVTYTTRSRQIADKIGVRNVTLQAKTGLFWETKSIYNEYEENTDTYFGGFGMTNPTEGAKYRAQCIHYTIINGAETSGYNETEVYTYTKN